MMMKELRGLFFGILVLILDLALLMLGLFSQDQLRLTIALLLLGIVLWNLFGQYRIRILGDCMMAYRMVFIFLFPEIIDYDQIQDINLKNDHHLVIKTSSLHHVYVWNGKKLYEILKEKCLSE